MLLEFLLVAIGVLLSVFIADVAARGDSSHDPSWIVIDEIVAMWLAVIPFPRTWWWYVLAFGFFRFFDIKKIFPICAVEILPGGWGIVLDDVVAAIFSIACLLPLVAIFWLAACPVNF